MIILGFTGSFGSGCSEIIKEFIEPRGFASLSLSTLLRDKYYEVHGKNNDERVQLQDFGNQLRKDHGADILANLAIDHIEKNKIEVIAIDSIRNPAEIACLKSRFGPFFLFGIYADTHIRWERVRKIYEGNQNNFDRDDKRDKGESKDYGQRVTDCYIRSDFIIRNNEPFEGERSLNYKLVSEKIDRCIELIQGKHFVPQEIETLMAMAYANSLRSSCLKRKVGAIIVDFRGNVFSSGYNEVPPSSEPCNKQYGGCYRDSLKQIFRKEIEELINDDEEKKSVYNFFKEKYKILDHCRSLHAEENAIMNVTRFGSSVALDKSTLFTTTYPCNLCANKIAQVGIKRVVYLEPYPMKEAVSILSEHSIQSKAFEGILFNGYFRFLN